MAFSANMDLAAGWAHQSCCRNWHDSTDFSGCKRNETPPFGAGARGGNVASRNQLQTANQAWQKARRNLPYGGSNCCISECCHTSFGNPPHITIWCPTTGKRHYSCDLGEVQLRRRLDEESGDLGVEFLPTADTASAVDRPRIRRPGHIMSRLSSSFSPRYGGHLQCARRNRPRPGPGAPFRDLRPIDIRWPVAKRNPDSTWADFVEEMETGAEVGAAAALAASTLEGNFMGPEEAWAVLAKSGAWGLRPPGRRRAEQTPQE